MNGVARRSFLSTVLTTCAAPSFIPAHVLGAEGGLSASNRITLGVIGTGAQGNWDLRVFLGHPDVRVTALCDINRRSLDSARGAVAERYGKADVKLFTDFRELAADPSIDAVLMALPVHWHSLAALETVLQGKHIYHEKPMAMSFEEGRRVRAAVRQKGVVFQFGTQQRSDAHFRWACELARSGRLGRLREIRVSAPGGKEGPGFPEQAVPDYVDWNRWVGPARFTPFHEEKLSRDNHENMSNFSLGMISCWGIHHLDIAQWGNDTDDTGPQTVEGTGDFPKGGAFDAILRWKVRYEYAQAAPVVFVNDGTPEFDHGIRFVGESGWVQVRRGAIAAHTQAFLDDPQNRPEALPVRLPVSGDHTRDFLDAIRKGRRAICDVGPALRGDTLCQLGLIAIQEGRKLWWNPETEQIVGDAGAGAKLQPRPFRGDWRLPTV